jgi:kynurenine formamidase
MDIDLQIKKTKQVIEENLAQYIDCNQLILENQLVILEKLKELSKVKDRAYFGPG